MGSPVVRVLAAASTVVLCAALAAAAAAPAGAQTAAPRIAGSSAGTPGVRGRVGELRASHVLSTSPASTGGQARARARLPFALPAPAVYPQPCPPPALPPGPAPPPLGRPVVAEAAVPKAAPPPPRRVNLSAITGKGIWLTLWPGQKVDVAAVLARAKSAGLRQIWLRTGSSSDGFYGAANLAALLPGAHAAGVAVIAWDFPTLSDPRRDAARARLALADGADGFAPDIESPAEGTFLTARRVAFYLSLVRGFARSRPVIATVPDPNRYWLATYPYRAEAPYIDAFAPMVYWACREPGAATAAAIAALRAMRPVAPIGQSYDMGPEGGPPGVPTGAEIWRFLDVARRSGALGASLYLYSQTGPPQWRAIAAYPWTPVHDRRLFGG